MCHALRSGERSSRARRIAPEKRTAHDLDFLGLAIPHDEEDDLAPHFPLEPPMHFDRRELGDRHTIDRDHLVAIANTRCCRGHPGRHFAHEQTAGVDVLTEERTDRTDGRRTATLKGRDTNNCRNEKREDCQQRRGSGGRFPPFPPLATLHSLTTLALTRAQRPEERALLP